MYFNLQVIFAYSDNWRESNEKVVELIRAATNVVDYKMSKNQYVPAMTG